MKGEILRTVEKKPELPNCGRSFSCIYICSPGVLWNEDALYEHAHSYCPLILIFTSTAPGAMGLAMGQVMGCITMVPHSASPQDETPLPVG